MSKRNFQYPLPARQCWTLATLIVRKYDEYASNMLVPLGVKIKEINPAEALIQFNFEHGFVATISMVNINAFLVQRGRDNWRIVEANCRFYHSRLRIEKTTLTLSAAQLLALREETNCWHGAEVITKEDILIPVSRWFNNNHNNVDYVEAGLEEGEAVLYYRPFVVGDFERVIEEAWSLPNPYRVEIDEYC